MSVETHIAELRVRVKVAEDGLIEQKTKLENISKEMRQGYATKADMNQVKVPLYTFFGGALGYLLQTVLVRSIG